MGDGILVTVDEIIVRLREADWKTRESVKDELLTVASAATPRTAVVEHLESIRMSLPLEIRWEVDEVLEALAPPPAPEPEEEEEVPPDPNAPLSAADLNVIYDDPRGLVVHKSKVGGRYFLTQRDPATGQPQTYELHSQEVQQLKTQLAGSPYWVLGSGEGV